MILDLEELALKRSIKCTCTNCNGTGIHVGTTKRNGLGIICYYCNGKGYNTLLLRNNIGLVKDEEQNIGYEVKNGIIIGTIKLFDKLQIRDDVKYVMYSAGKNFSPNYLFEHGASEINIITYKEFINGALPLPMMQYTCPAKISLQYGKGEFFNDCDIGSFENCKKFGTQECWEKFYGKAKTIEEKQNVLKRVK